MDGLRLIKRAVVIGGVSLAALLTVGVITAPDEPTDVVTTRTRTGALSGYSHEQLQIDSNMIGQMSTPNADNTTENHRRDGQLARSQNPNYLAALEQHQADIDRMLARGTP